MLSCKLREHLRVSEGNRHRKHKLSRLRSRFDAEYASLSYLVIKTEPDD